MASASSRSSWIPLGDTILDHRPIYAYSPNEWPHASHDHLHIAISRSGSFIATCRNDQKPFFVLNATTMAVPLTIYRGNGALLKSVDWTRELASILCIGWTDIETLVTILDDGTVRIYEVYGDPTVFSLGEEARMSGIASCRIIPSGLAVLTVSGIFVVVRSWRNPIAREYSHYRSPDIPLAWTIVPESFTSSNSVELLISTDTGLDTVSEINSSEKNFPPCRHFCLSPNTQFIALVSMKNMLQIRIISSLKQAANLDLSSVIDDIQTAFQLAWCGNEAIVLASPETVVMLHISGEFHTIDLMDPVYLSESCDAIFTLSITGLNMYHIVPYPMLNAFQIGSTHPIAVLMDALNHYSRDSPQAVDLLEFLLKGNQLATALMVGIEAASHAWEVHDQRVLLSAVQFGRAWHSIGTSEDPSNQQDTHHPHEIRDLLVTTARKLRVLNSARRLGFPITKLVLNEIGQVPGFIKLLVRTRNHDLAIRSADLLQLKNARAQTVLDWARLHLTEAPVQGNVEEAVQNVVHRIQDLNLDPAVDFSSLALCCIQVGRNEAAAKILDYETNIARQVPLLLDLHQSTSALARAVESYDRDLVYFVLIYLRKTLMLPEFLRTVQAVPGAYSYFEQYARENDRKLLRDCLSLQDANIELGYLILEESTTLEISIEEKAGLLRDALHAFSRAKNSSWEQQLVEQQLQLVHSQAQLQETLSVPSSVDWTSLSAAETINQLIIKNRVEKAKSLKTSLRMSDKLWSWCMVHGLSRARDWAELEGFVLSKRPVIGYLPVVKACLSMGAPSEAVKYIVKCDIRTRVPLYIKAGAIQEAAQVAWQLRDMPQLVQLRQHQPMTEEIRRDINAKIAQLRQG